MSINPLPQPPPANHEWIRQVFSLIKTEGVQLVLHDRAKGLNLSHITPRSLNVAGVLFDDYVGAPENDRLTSPVHMIAHIGGERVDVENHLYEQEEEKNNRQAIILNVSSIPALSKDSNSSANFVWLSMKNREAYKKVSDWLPEFLKLDFEEAALIADASKRDKLSPEIQRKYSNLLNITHPGDATSEHAFRLLCEAYMLCDGKSSKEMKGITIHAPTKPEHWLAPFGINPEDKNAINQLAGMIGTGEIKTKVKDVLQSVTEEDNDLKSAIEEFLNATSETSTQL